MLKASDIAASASSKRKIAFIIIFHSSILCFLYMCVLFMFLIWNAEGKSGNIKESSNNVKKSFSSFRSLSFLSSSSQALYLIIIFYSLYFPYCLSHRRSKTCWRCARREEEIKVRWKSCYIQQVDEFMDEIQVIYCINCDCLHLNWFNSRAAWRINRFVNRLFGEIEKI